MKKFYLLLCLAFVIALPAICPAQEGPKDKKEDIFPFVGRLNGDRVNLRIKPEASAYVVTQITQGEDLFVIGQKDDWYEVLYPAKVSFWVYSKYVIDGQINGSQVHVRLGPGVNYPSMIQLETGTPLEVRSEQGSWVEITPPKESSAWISAEYVSYFCPMNQYSQRLEDEKEAQRLLLEADAQKKEEFEKPVEQVRFEMIINLYKGILAKYPFSNEAKTALATINDLEIKKLYRDKQTNSSRIDELQIEREKILLQIQSIRDDFYQGRSVADNVAYETALRLVNLLEQTYPGTAEAGIGREVFNDIARICYKQDQQSASEEGDYISYTGRVQLRKRSSDPGTHVLVKGLFNRSACMLKSNSIDLDVYVNSTVTVTGPVTMIKDFKAPMMNVRKVKVEKKRD